MVCRQASGPRRPERAGLDAIPVHEPWRDEGRKPRADVLIESAETLNERRDRDLRRSRSSVVGLDCNPQPSLRQRGAKYALCARLGEGARAQRGHDLGIEPPCPGDRRRMGRHRRPDPPGRARTSGRQPFAGREPRETKSQRAQRNRIGRDRAAVDRSRLLVQPRLCHFGDHSRNLALDPMIRSDIAPRVDPFGAGEADKSRVLARAIVVQRVRRPP